MRIQNVCRSKPACMRLTTAQKKSIPKSLAQIQAVLAECREQLDGAVKLSLRVELGKPDQNC